MRKVNGRHLGKRVRRFSPKRKVIRVESEETQDCEGVIELEPRGSRRNKFRAKRARAFHEDQSFGATIGAVTKPSHSGSLLR